MTAAAVGASENFYTICASQRRNTRCLESNKKVARWHRSRCTDASKKDIPSMVGDMGGASRCVMPLLGGNIDMYEQEWIYIYICTFLKSQKGTGKSFFGSALPWSNGLAGFIPMSKASYTGNIFRATRRITSTCISGCVPTHTLRCNRLMPTAFNQEALVLLAG